MLEEPWYQHGIFSVQSIPLNAEQMLIQPWQRLDHFPYFVPTGFGGSIFLNSPLLLLIFWRGVQNRTIKNVSWIAFSMLTLVLWLHGNPGGWQFSYRYAMILLPWVYLILLESTPRRSWRLDAVVVAVSVAINAYATYLFYWTNYVQP